MEAEKSKRKPVVDMNAGLYSSLDTLPKYSAFCHFPRLAQVSCFPALPSVTCFLSGRPYVVSRQFHGLNQPSP